MTWFKNLFFSHQSDTPAPTSTPLDAIATQIEATSEATVLAESARLAPILSSMIESAGRALHPGQTTLQVSRVLASLAEQGGLYPAMLGYNGFPAAAAVSVNNEVVHAIPSERTLVIGDIVTIEFSIASAQGYASQGWTFPVGTCEALPRSLMLTAQAALHKGCNAVRHHARVGDVSHAIQSEVEAAGFAVVRDFVGYGMGQRRIQEPKVPGTGLPGRGPRLQRGQILHLHVIAKQGDWRIVIDDNDWTALSDDGGLAVLFTCMVRVDDNGATVLSGLLGSA